MVLLGLEKLNQQKPWFGTTKQILTAQLAINIILIFECGTQVFKQSNKQNFNKHLLLICLQNLSPSLCIIILED